MPCSRTQHGLTRVGLEPPTSGSGVRGINHQATALPVFLQVTRPCIKAWISLNFGKIPSQTTELAALEGLKNQCIML